MTGSPAGPVASRSRTVVFVQPLPGRARRAVSLVDHDHRRQPPSSALPAQRVWGSGPSTRRPAADRSPSRASARPRRRSRRAGRVADVIRSPVVTRCSSPGWGRARLESCVHRAVRVRRCCGTALCRNSPSTMLVSRFDVGMMRRCAERVGDSEVFITTSRTCRSTNSIQPLRDSRCAIREKRR